MSKSRSSDKGFFFSAQLSSNSYSLDVFLDHLHRITPQGARYFHPHIILRFDSELFAAGGLDKRGGSFKISMRRFAASALTREAF
jgi:hypothetical protein